MLYRAGHTATNIAQLFGFHRQTVARHLKRAGLNTSDPVFRMRVQQTYQTIGTIKGTARQLGVSPGAVRVVVQGGQATRLRASCLLIFYPPKHLAQLSVGMPKFPLFA